MRDIKYRFVQNNLDYLAELDWIYAWATPMFPTQHATTAADWFLRYPQILLYENEDDYIGVIAYEPLSKTTVSVHIAMMPGAQTPSVTSEVSWKVLFGLWNRGVERIIGWIADDNRVARLFALPAGLDEHLHVKKHPGYTPFVGYTENWRKLYDKRRKV